MKSEWPGVSIRLVVTPSRSNETTVDRIVIPRRRSRSRASVCVEPSSTRPTSSMTPAACRSRSVSVVLPASTCATMPRLIVGTGVHVLCVGVRYLRAEHERSAHVLLLLGWLKEPAEHETPLVRNRIPRLRPRLRPAHRGPVASFGPCNLLIDLDVTMAVASDASAEYDALARVLRWMMSGVGDPPDRCDRDRLRRRARRIARASTACLARGPCPVDRQGRIARDPDARDLGR